MKWEYKIFSSEFAFPAYQERDLNYLGQEGWEVVAVIVSPMGKDFPNYIYLKRPLKQ